MSMEFGWWVRDPEQGKYQVRVVIHGGNITWKRKHGHNIPWAPLEPVTAEDWDKLIAEAETRVPRRLLSPKQFEDIKRLRSKTGF
ncbi:MAG: hypothetical protein ABII82_11455 [Verrucomicrobiota bacterium]